tara:strand:+ start:74 stop:724 length:651 start_codon:yes stop_codon:yes gene_type:complete
MNLIKPFTLFGFPVMSTKLDKKSYNKKSIISAIEKNFKLNKVRNKWDKTSVLHHVYNDGANPQFNKIPYDTLIPVYQQALIAMFNRLELLSSFRFNFKIINYTCLSSSNFMNSHLHEGADFSGVHYIQFDKNHHTPTMFENTSPHIDYLLQLRPKLMKLLSNKHPSNSWAFKDWSLDTEEDDFCFSPAYLKHRINPQTSKKKNRITIVLNITLEPK